MERFDLWWWAELVREHRPRRAGAPPAVMRMMLDQGVPPAWFDSVRSWVTASAPLGRELAERFEDRYGIPVLQGYGATEFLGPVTGWTLDDWGRWRDAKLGSVGRPLPGCAVRVVDADTGAERPTGARGLLEVAATGRGPDPGGGWVRTRDVASVDDDGFVWIFDRIDDVIVRGGFKVPLGEVEAILLQHQSVADACAVGIEDPRLGQVPVAAVVAREGAVLDVEELIAFSRSRLAPYQVPVAVVALDELPRTATMKVRRAEVRSLLLARLSER